jgi:hypothetical protein
VLTPKPEVAEEEKTMPGILRMNRQRIPELIGRRPPPSLLLQIFMFTGFCAEMNLLKVAQAFGHNDRAALAEAPERNAKLARIRTEIEAQVRTELAKGVRNDYLSRKLTLVSNIALFFENFGSQTVELSTLCAEILRSYRSNRRGPINDIQKLMENAVYMADSAAAALVYDELPWAQTALQQGQASAVLYKRINQSLALDPLNVESSSSLSLFCLLVSHTSEMLAQTEQMVNNVIGNLRA